MRLSWAGIRPVVFRAATHIVQEMLRVLIVAAAAVSVDGHAEEVLNAAKALA